LIGGRAAAGPYTKTWVEYVTFNIKGSPGQLATQLYVLSPPGGTLAVVAVLNSYSLAFLTPDKSGLTSSTFAEAFVNVTVSQQGGGKIGVQLEALLRDVAIANKGSHWSITAAVLVTFYG
jgi:hypothetical protein